MVVYADRAALPQLARPRRQSTRHDHRQRLTTEQRLTRALLALSAAAIPLTVLSPHDDPNGALGGARLREVAIAVPIAVFAGLLINVAFAALKPTSPRAVRHRRFDGDMDGDRGRRLPARRLPRPYSRSAGGSREPLWPFSHRDEGLWPEEHATSALLVRVWLYAFIAHLVRDLVIQLGPHGATLLIVHHLLCFVGIAVFLMTPRGGMLIALGPLVTEMGSGLLNLWAVDLALRGMNAPCWPKGDAVPWLAPALYGYGMTLSNVGSVALLAIVGMDNLAAGHWGFTAFFWASGPPLLVMRQLQAIDVLRGAPRPRAQGARRPLLGNVGRRGQPRAAGARPSLAHARAGGLRAGRARARAELKIYARRRRTRARAHALRERLTCPLRGSWPSSRSSAQIDGDRDQHDANRHEAERVACPLPGGGPPAGSAETRAHVGDRRRRRGLGRRRRRRGARRQTTRDVLERFHRRCAFRQERQLPYQFWRQRVARRSASQRTRIARLRRRQRAALRHRGCASRRRRFRTPVGRVGTRVYFNEPNLFGSISNLATRAYAQHVLRSPTRTGIERARSSRVVAVSRRRGRLS